MIANFLRNVLIDLSALFLVGVSNASYAALISTESGLVDQATGLNWLTLTATQGISFNDVVNGYGGFISNGWRYATDEEVTRLFADAGGSSFDAGANPRPNPTCIGGCYQANLAPAKLLVSLLGFTIDASNDIAFTFAGLGITGTSTYPLVHHTAFYQFNEYKDIAAADSSGGYLFSPYGDHWDWYSNSQNGSFLVRDAVMSSVPEPGTYGMVLLGVGLMGAISRRRKMNGLPPL